MHDGYRCSCNQVWLTLDEAQNCWNCSADLISICDVCGKGHFDSDRAQECEESHMGVDSVAGST
jgi:hypothetical protein